MHATPITSALELALEPDVERPCAALVVAAAGAEDRKVAGLTLSERARRVLVRSGIAAADVHVVRAPEAVRDLAPELAGRPLVVVWADGWAVDRPLLAALRSGEPGTRAAVDAHGVAAVRLGPADARTTLSHLSRDLHATPPFAMKLEAGPRARHIADGKAEARAAEDWLLQLSHRPLDSFLTTHFYRPLARPLTRFFAATPLTPNMISVLATLLSVAGCALAAFPGYLAHVLGLALLVFGGIVDCNDGEVARLRHEGSELGAWLDVIGDNVARLALIIGIGVHVAPLYPGLPITTLTGITLLFNVIPIGLIYWYCIVVIKSADNDSYGTTLHGVEERATSERPRSIVQRLEFWGAELSRREAMDLVALGLAVFGLPIATFTGLLVGALIGFPLVLSNHLKIVAARRAAARA